MTYNRQNARQLCSAAELELVLLSFPDMIEGLSAARLKLKRARARALRDKYRDLLRRQKLATRDRTGSKLGRGPKTNLRTAEKAKLFDETLKRFEAKLAATEAAARKGVRAAKVAQAKQERAAKSSARTRAVSKPRPAKTPGPSGEMVSPKAPAKVPSPARSPKAPTAFGYVSERAQQASRAGRLKAMGSVKVRAHVSARGRRNQAKRDARSG